MKTTLTKESPLALLNTQLASLFVSQMSKADREQPMAVAKWEDFAEACVDNIEYRGKKVVNSDIDLANELAAKCQILLDEQYPNGVYDSIGLAYSLVFFQSDRARKDIYAKIGKTPPKPELTCVLTYILDLHTTLQRTRRY